MAPYCLRGSGRIWWCCAAFAIACGNELSFKNMPDDRYKFHFENLHGSTFVQHCSVVKVAHVHNVFCEKHLSLLGQSLLVANMTWREGGQVLKV